jgi:hypothetical protein
MDIAGRSTTEEETSNSKSGFHTVENDEKQTFPVPATNPTFDMPNTTWDYTNFNRGPNLPLIKQTNRPSWGFQISWVHYLGLWTILFALGIVLTLWTAVALNKTASAAISILPVTAANVDCGSRTSVDIILDRASVPGVNLGSDIGIRGPMAPTVTVLITTVTTVTVTQTMAPATLSNGDPTFSSSSLRSVSMLAFAPGFSTSGISNTTLWNTQLLSPTVFPSSVKASAAPLLAQASQPTNSKQSSSTRLHLTTATDVFLLLVTVSELPKVVKPSTRYFDPQAHRFEEGI